MVDREKVYALVAPLKHIETLRSAASVIFSHGDRYGLSDQFIEECRVAMNETQQIRPIEEFHDEKPVDYDRHHHTIVRGNHTLWSRDVAGREMGMDDIMKQRILEGATTACRCCMDIFDDFDWSEIKMEPRSIQMAWECGKNLIDATEAHKEDTSMMRQCEVIKCDKLKDGDRKE